MAPPLGLTLRSGTPRARTQYTACTLREAHRSQEFAGQLQAPSRHAWALHRFQCLVTQAPGLAPQQAETCACHRRPACQLVQEEKRQRPACEAKASLISYTSISSSRRPAACSARGMATAGPMPSTAGGTPTAAKLRRKRGADLTCSWERQHRFAASSERECNAPVCCCKNGVERQRGAGAAECDGADACHSRASRAGSSWVWEQAHTCERCPGWAGPAWPPPPAS